ncbi:MAG: lysylphosphatidylglycerol synthase transmembrane domain-containing protein [Kiloniellales bacterium]
MQQRLVKAPKKWLLAALKVAVSVVLLALLARSTDLGAIADTLGRLPIAAMVLACALLVAQTLVLGLRWWLVMRAIRAPIGYAKLVPLIFTGIFFNQVLPTSFGGDAVRMWQAHRAGVRPEAAVGGVLLERISGVLGLVILSALGVWYMGSQIDNQALRLGLLAMLPLGFLGALVLASLDRIPDRWRRLRLLDDLARLAKDARCVLFAPGTALPLLLLSILSHALAAAAVYVFASSLHLGLSVWDCLALFPPVILVTLIPISFAGWGLREGAMVALFAFAGVNADTALALSLAFGVALLAASLPGYACWLAWRGPPMLESVPRPSPDSR